MTESSVSQSADIVTGAKLGSAAAIWNALRWREVDFYPLVAEGGTVSTLGTSTMLQEMERASARWCEIEDNEALKTAIDLAKQSLAEVKAQTEYQDQKATRLLTITSFLSALSGVLFGRFVDAYPVGTVLSQPNGIALLLAFGYVSFAAFVTFSLSGALVTFHATRTRFKYPEAQKTEDQEKDPRSLLFYQALIRSRPRAWIDGWVTGGANGDSGDKPTLRDDLRQRYLSHLIRETYLIAAKTADKLRYLEPAQSLLANSLRCLFVWLAVLALISIFVPSTKPPVKPVQAVLVPGLLQSSSPAASVPAKNLTSPAVAAPATAVGEEHP